MTIKPGRGQSIQRFFIHIFIFIDLFYQASRNILS